MFVVFDLDGTLALNEHREHFINRPPGERDWDAFFEACDKDVPNWQIVQLARHLKRAGHRVEIWTGRTSAVLDKTVAWLEANGLGGIFLKCRPYGDHRPDHVLKLEWLETERGWPPDLVFEDRARVVEMWREQGIVCAQVAKGDF